MLSGKKRNLRGTFFQRQCSKEPQGEGDQGLSGKGVITCVRQGEAIHRGCLKLFKVRESARTSDLGRQRGGESKYENSPYLIGEGTLIGKS